MGASCVFYIYSISECLCNMQVVSFCAIPRRHAEAGRVTTGAGPVTLASSIASERAYSIVFSVRFIRSVFILGDRLPGRASR